MKKTDCVKGVLAAAIAAGCLCACSGSEGEGTRGRMENPTGTEEQKPTPTEEETKPTAAADPTKAAGGNQNSEDEKLITEEVESVSIRYYIGYNIATGDVISDSVPCYQIDVTGEDLDAMAAAIAELSKVSVDPKSEEFGHIMYDQLNDDYELTINGDFVVTIGAGYGCSVTTSEMVRVPAELYALADRLAQENNEANAYKTLGGEQISVTDQNGKVWDVTDAEQLEEISATRYYVLAITEEELEGERIAYVVDLHNGDQLDVYFASVLGRLRHADESYEYIHIQELEDYLDRVFPQE